MNFFSPDDEDVSEAAVRVATEVVPFVVSRDIERIIAPRTKIEMVFRSNSFFTDKTHPPAVSFNSMSGGSKILLKKQRLWFEI